MFRIALTCLAVLSLRADPPNLEAIYPAGGAPGSTNVVTFSGKIEPWPPQVWVDSGGLEFIAQTNKGKFDLRIAPDAQPGPRLVRVFNEEGASDPQFFVVGSGPETDEAEPNDHFEKPQKVESLPVTINGRLDKGGDVDSYQVNLKAGDWLDAQLDSYTMMRSVDAVLRLVDHAGHHRAFNHDFATLDPRLIWQAPVDQTVVVQVFGFLYPANSSVNLTGGTKAVYRLHIQSSPQPPQELSRKLDDIEPNNSAAQAQPLSIPGSVKAVIGGPRDEDRLVFEAKKGEVLEFDVAAAAEGSPLDALLRVEDLAGKELARNDDADRARDPALEWTAPEDGRFVLAVSSLTHRGGPDYRYTLTARQLAPAFEATIASHAVTLEAGATNELKLAVKMLRGFTNQLTVSCSNLPEGVTASPLEIPVKGGEVTLALTAATNAPAFNQPFKIVVHDGTNGTPAAFSFISRSTDNGVPGGYTTLLVERTDDLWLTVRARKEAAPADAPPAAAEAGK